MLIFEVFTVLARATPLFAALIPAASVSGKKSSACVVLRLFRRQPVPF
jgi:hypothetical protein